MGASGEVLRTRRPRGEACSRAEVRERDEWPRRRRGRVRRESSTSGATARRRDSRRSPLPGRDESGSGSRGGVRTSCGSWLHLSHHECLRRQTSCLMAPTSIKPGTAPMLRNFTRCLESNCCRRFYEGCQSRMSPPGGEPTTTDPLMATMGAIRIGDTTLRSCYGLPQMAAGTAKHTLLKQSD